LNVGDSVFCYGGILWYSEIKNIIHMAQKPTILGLNWKMNPQSRQEALHVLEGMSDAVARMRQTQIMLFPPSIFFDYVRELERQYGLYCSMGVQDIGMTKEGSYTGQIGAPMAFDSGAECVLIGHSETRRRQTLTDEEVHAKFVQAVESKLTPILCVGFQETIETKEVDYDAIRTQIRTVLEDKRSYVRECGVTIAYEPTWAIGTGTPADAETIETVCLFIRKQVAGIAGQDMRDVVNVLYGGSVDGENIDDFMPVRGLNGFLLGGASLKPYDISVIIHALEHA